MQSNQFAIFKKHNLAESKGIAYMETLFVGSMCICIVSFGISVYELMHMESLIAYRPVIT